jgi:hypothetical protein
MRALEFADQILRGLDAPNPHILAPENMMANPKVRQIEKTRFKAAIVEVRQQIVRKFPELERTLVKPWDDIQQLIDVAGASKGIHRLVRPIVHDGAVYVVGMGAENGKDQFVQLLRFSLADGKKSELGKVALEHRHSVHSDIDFEVGLRSLFGRGACIHDGRYYFGSASHGIFVFALDAGKVDRLTTGTGLPSDHVHDLACVAGKLFAGLGEEGKEGYLAVIDLKTNECKVVASSRRKEKLSPFDDSQPLFSKGFIADPKRKRVLFVASIRDRYDVSGLWEFDATSDKLRKHRSFYLFSTTDFEWACPLPGERILIATGGETILFDLQTNKSEARPFKNMDTNRTHRYVQPRLKEIVALARPDKDVPLHLRGGDVIYGDWLWSGYPFGRVTLDGAEKFRFEPARQKYNRYFNPNECFQVFDNGAGIVLADQHGIWIARLSHPK